MNAPLNYFMRYQKLLNSAKILCDNLQKTIMSNLKTHKFEYFWQEALIFRISLKLYFAPKINLSNLFIDCLQFSLHNMHQRNLSKYISKAFIVQNTNCDSRPIILVQLLPHGLITKISTIRVQNAATISQEINIFPHILLP